MVPSSLSQSSTQSMSRHATERCRGRGISLAAVWAAIDYGCCRADRGALIYTLGWRQIARLARQGTDLSRFEGTEVVCSHGGQIVTVYRNRRRTPRCPGADIHLRAMYWRGSRLSG